MCCEFQVNTFIWADGGLRFYYLLFKDSDGPRKEWKVVLVLFSLHI